mmetsp:Transcript_28460/g.72932  ORF Transcript_28460/g.72932 Transcript_28460/m.72932 type:complete len:139 (-) Transcript_28460:689-1105(-)
MAQSSARTQDTAHQSTLRLSALAALVAQYTSRTACFRCETIDCMLLVLHCQCSSLPWREKKSCCIGVDDLDSSTAASPRARRSSLAAHSRRLALIPAPLHPSTIPSRTRGTCSVDLARVRIWVATEHEDDLAILLLLC